MACKPIVMKTGWLDKQSKHLKVFRTRWIECYSGDKLYSFTKQASQSPTEIIDLSQVHKAYKSNLNQNEFLLAYVINGEIKSRRFRANTYKEASDWVEFINNNVGRDLCYHCCSKLDEQIMSKDIDQYRVNTEYHTHCHTSNDSKNHKSQSPNSSPKFIDYSSAESSTSDASSIASSQSLEEFIEEIAYDIVHNHQYLTVVLECKKNIKSS